jgi:hypothetical protein
LFYCKVERALYRRIRGAHHRTMELDGAGAIGLLY